MHIKDICRLFHPLKSSFSLAETEYSLHRSGAQMTHELVFFLFSLFSVAGQ